MTNFWDFIVWMLWIYIFMAFLFVLFGIFRDIFRDKDLNGWLKALWIIFLIFIPVLGALIYLVARGRGMAQRNASDLAAAQREQNQYIKSVAGSAQSPSEEIASAGKLLASGAITTEEYEKLKAKALA
ncbi:membrane protein [Microbacterium mangrovi]|uniref:Membrane protein n=1 Tax=Microbacterium mangrovi TaxID=1348253 RepID=A0A0B2A7P0_9MICO|nr:membrane protein [Microbacterium mangrovi]